MQTNSSMGQNKIECETKHPKGERRKHENTNTHSGRSVWQMSKKPIWTKHRGHGTSFCQDEDLWDVLRCTCVWQSYGTTMGIAQIRNHGPLSIVTNWQLTMMIMKSSRRKLHKDRPLPSFFSLFQQMHLLVQSGQECKAFVSLFRGCAQKCVSNWPSDPGATSARCSPVAPGLTRGRRSSRSPVTKRRPRKETFQVWRASYMEASGSPLKYNCRLAIRLSRPNERYDQNPDPLDVDRMDFEKWSCVGADLS